MTTVLGRPRRAVARGRDACIRERPRVNWVTNPSAYKPTETFAVPEPRIELTSVNPQLEGEVWSSDTILRIGRLNTLEVFLDDPSISRRHAEILATDDGWVIHDLGSMNGTYLNST